MEKLKKIDISRLEDELIKTYELLIREEPLMFTSEYKKEVYPKYEIKLYDYLLASSEDKSPKYSIKKVVYTDDYKEISNSDTGGWYYIFCGEEELSRIYDSRHWSERRRKKSDDEYVRALKTIMHNLLTVFKDWKLKKSEIIDYY